jgi:hypothetical protein
MMTDSFLQVKAEMFLLVDSLPCNRMEVIKCEELPRSVMFAELNHSCSFPSKSKQIHVMLELGHKLDYLLDENGTGILVPAFGSTLCDH